MALKRKPDSAECYFNLATALNDKGDKKAARQNFKTCIKHDDSNADAYYELGLIAMQSGEIDDIDGAREAFQKALARNPHHAKAREALA